MLFWIQILQKQLNCDHLQRVAISLFILSWSLNNSGSNVRIVWTYKRKTRGFNKNRRKHPSELGSLKEEETEYYLMEFEFRLESFTTAILDKFHV